jgi:Ser/Thr protein kinase RdoA (MazF antagonist)
MPEAIDRAPPSWFEGGGDLGKVRARLADHARECTNRPKRSRNGFLARTRGLNPMCPNYLHHRRRVRKQRAMARRAQHVVDRDAVFG